MKKQNDLMGRPAIEVKPLETGAVVVHDIPSYMYGGQLTVKRLFVMPIEQRFIFEMRDEHGRVYLANIDREQLKSTLETGEALFGN